jgi:hypothetical protein
MIIQIESSTAENVEVARRSLVSLAQSRGCQIAEPPAEVTAPAKAMDSDDKVIDPVSVAALVVSLPSAALAVLDLADRIQKRRRAKELIDQAQQLAAQQVTLSVITQTRTVEIRTMAPDQLLDLLAEQDSAS